MIYLAAILLVFVFCGTYIHFRGSRRLSLARQVTDYSVIMAPVNCLFYTFSRVPNKPFQKPADFPELRPITDNWKVIRDEALDLERRSQIVSTEDDDDLGFASFFKTGWKRFYLKWYGSRLNSAESLCPKTLEILESVPSVRGGMFAMLPPGGRLGGHRDPYAGSIRYHLGLVTPNSEDCYLDVDGNPYYWKDGEEVLFDETFIHSAENNTDQNRIILFLDVKRPLRFFLMDWFDALFCRIFMSATVAKNIRGDKVGFLNRVFPKVYSLRHIGGTVKGYNRTLYYVLKHTILALIAYFVFVHWWLF